MAQSRCHYDAHCHLFNLNYLLLESANILFDLLLGKYGSAVDKTARKESVWKNVLNFIKWVKELPDGFFDSEAEHLDHLQEALGLSWKGQSVAKPVKIVPLMMDIYYTFAQPVFKNQLAEVSTKSYDDDDEEKTIGDSLTEVERILQEDNYDKKKVEGAIQALKKWVNEYQLTVKTPYEDSLGFWEHRNALEDLWRPTKSPIYPFFAVDPRRRGVIKAVLDGKVVGPGKPFHGIKLYPRLGYHPLCKDLEELFKWCDKQRVPITTHCGPSGFPPILDGYPEFGSPFEFGKILETHETLIIDFAHFGSQCALWKKEIVRLMEFPYVFTDLSCYSKPKEVVEFKELYWTEKNIQDRTMFGTDYSMIYFDAFAGLDQYYLNFRDSHNPGAFTIKELEHMDEVAERFLNV